MKLHQANEAAKALGANYFYDLYSDGWHISRSYIETDKAVNGQYREIAHYSRTMDVFVALERLCPEQLIGIDTKHTTTTTLRSII